MQSWHPTLRRILESGLLNCTDTFGSASSSTALTDKSIQLGIDEIWLFDDIHHAASIDLNAGRIGPVHGWSDGGRDIVNFLKHVYEGPKGVYDNKKILEWRQDIPGGRRRRKVVGLGHSFGGNALYVPPSTTPTVSIRMLS